MTRLCAMQSGIRQTDFFSTFHLENDMIDFIKPLIEEFEEIMSYYEQDAVIIYERKYALDYLFRMYQEGRLYFPRTELMTDNPSIAAKLLKAIQIGIPMPVIYVSEMQNGDFLILESKNQIIALLEYLQGLFPVRTEEIFQNLRFVFFYELNAENPRLAAMILRTVFQFQIIDYQTPKYLHMETGLFHEEWNTVQEQAVRNILYDGHGIEALHSFSNDIIQRTRCYFPSGNAMNEIEILYMMLFWGLYKKKFPVETQANPGEQLLLEITVQNLYFQSYEWSDFLNIIESFTACCVMQPFFKDPACYWYSPAFNEKAKLKTLGISLCLYDIFLCKGREPYSSLNYFFTSNMYIPQIDALPLTLNNIRFYLASLWEDTRL